MSIFEKHGIHSPVVAAVIITRIAGKFRDNCFTLTLRKDKSRMIYLTRLEHFNAAHKLYNPAWSKEKNEEVFGKCANENWHGHNYELYVTVKGEIR